MLIDIHMLQNYAPSNLNRDDTGAPKDAIFGNAIRARISSQAIKRSIRRSAEFTNAFKDHEELLAKRTQMLPVKVREYLKDKGLLDEPAIKVIAERAREVGRESGGPLAALKEGEVPKTAQLIFIADGEIPAVAEQLAEKYQEMGSAKFKKEHIDELLKDFGRNAPRSIDIAMFGRMTTSAAFENANAAVQVAHAISTHKIESEFDYYTAVDDVSGEAGAGFIGDTAFNSATYYKYFSIHWEGLLDNLGKDATIAARAVAALLRAAALVNPTGKQNSFAAHNLPDLILVEAREANLPVSYANAFLKPVWAGGNTSLMDASLDALKDYMTRIQSVYAIPSQRAWVGTGNNWELPDCARQSNLDALIGWLPLASQETA